MKRSRFLLLVLIFTLLIFAILIQPSGTKIVIADDEDVSAELVPSSVQVSVSEKAETTLIVTNNTEDEISDVQISYYPDDIVEIEFQMEGKDVIAAHETAGIILNISRVKEDLIKDSVYIKLEYSTATTDDNSGTGGLLIKPLEVTGLGKYKESKSLEISSEMANSSLVENTPGQIFLTVKNTSNEPIEIKEFNLYNDPVLELVPKEALPVILAPFDEKIFEIDVSISPNAVIQSGDYFIGINVNVETMQSHQTLVAATKQKVQLGVFGESTLLAILEIPSLLVLPGFLITMIFVSLWKLKPGKWKTFGATSPEFWLIAISLSLGIIFLYPVLTTLLVKMKLLGSPHNLLKGHNVMDIAILWIFSILIGTVAYLIAITANNSYLRMKEAQKFNGRENELGLLKKLIKNQMSFFCKRASVKLNDEEKKGFLIQYVKNDKTAILCPYIGISWLSDTAKDKDLITRLLESNNLDDMKKLLALLKRGKRRNEISVRWEVDDYLRKCVQIGEIVELKEEDDELSLLIII
jgi:hypothetical protein